MKRVLFFAAAICIMLSAQAQTKHGKSSDSLLKSSIQRVEMLNRQENTFTQQLDSMVSVDMMTSYIFQYDERYNIAHLTGTGLFNMNEDFYYDDQNRVVRFIVSYFGMYYSQTEFTYNSQGWVTEELVYDYDDNVWVYDYKIVYSYDNDGNLLLAQTYEYQPYSEVWKYNEKVEHTYTNGHLTLSTQYEWNDNTESWDYDYKTEYNYNSDGYISEQFDYSFGWDSWIHEGRTTYTYDNNFNCEYQIEYEYDYDSQNQSYEWVADDQIQFFYDLNVPSNTVAGLWFFEEKFANVDFVSGGITKLNNKLLRVEETTFDYGKTNRTLVTEFYYSSVTAVNETHEMSLILWPNPTTESLSLNAEGLRQVEIFSLDGRLVMSLNKGIESIDVTSLAQGAYLLKATREDGSQVMKKFVKE